jgi:hypothetical protein
MKLQYLITININYKDSDAWEKQGVNRIGNAIRDIYTDVKDVSIIRVEE